MVTRLEEVGKPTVLFFISSSVQMIVFNLSRTKPTHHLLKKNFYNEAHYKTFLRMVVSSCTKLKFSQSFTNFVFQTFCSFFHNFYMDCFHAIIFQVSFPPTIGI